MVCWVEHTNRTPSLTSSSPAKWQNPVPKSFVLSRLPILIWEVGIWRMGLCQASSFNSLNLWLDLVYVDGKLKHFHLRTGISYLSEKRASSVTITFEASLFAEYSVLSQLLCAHPLPTSS